MRGSREHQLMNTNKPINTNPYTNNPIPKQKRFHFPDGRFFPLWNKMSKHYIETCMIKKIMNQMETKDVALWLKCTQGIYSHVFSSRTLHSYLCSRPLAFIPTLLLCRRQTVFTHKVRRVDTSKVHTRCHCYPLTTVSVLFCLVLPPKHFPLKYIKTLYLGFAFRLNSWNELHWCLHGEVAQPVVYIEWAATLISWFLTSLYAQNRYC